MNRRQFLGAAAALAASPALAKLAPIAEAAAPAANAEVVAQAAAALQRATGALSVGDMITMRWGSDGFAVIEKYRVTSVDQHVLGVVVADDGGTIEIATHGNVRVPWNDPVSTPIEDLRRAKRAIERAPRLHHVSGWRSAQAGREAAFRAKAR